LYWEHERNKAIRIGDWKLVMAGDNDWELYNLANDRAEVNNLAAAHPERVQIMADRWEAWARSAKVVPRDRSEK
jgi:arylsulfatase